jgi:ribonuclease P protein component
VAAGDARFPRQYRLHVPSEFDEVFRNRRVLKGRWFHLHYGPIVTQVRLGLVIPKKFARHAVLRNTMKRIGREAFRCARNGLPARELVLRLAGKADKLRISRTERSGWRAEIDELLQRVPK